MLGGKGGIVVDMMMIRSGQGMHKDGGGEVRLWLCIRKIFTERCLAAEHIYRSYFKYGSNVCVGLYVMEITLTRSVDRIL